MARMREIGVSFDKGYRDDLNYNFGLLEALIGEANGLTDNLREEMLGKINNLQQQIDMLTGENIGELLERLNDSIQQALTAAQEARTAKTATEEATALAKAATELANASALLAEEKANYANEKAVLAQEAADNANQEASNLSQLKIDVVQATQDANTATGNANQATQAAQTATDAINVVLPNVEGLVNLKEWNTETQYKKNNFVTLEGNGYMALRDNKGGRPPSLPVLSNADWAMFVQKGEKGEQGTGVRILGTLPDESSLPPIGEPGDAYLINGDLYVWSDTTNDWTNVGTIKGPKGETGPQGPEGPRGLPGKDADLTEVNQEIANIKQTVSDNKTEVTEHLGQKILSENGVHGIRYFNDRLEIENGADWSEIEIGKPNANGTVKITDNHAIRSFPSIIWDNNTNKEEIRFTFNDFKVSGYFKIKMATNRSVGANANGGAEVIIQTSTDITTGQILISEMNIVTMHDAFAANIGTAIAWVDDGTNKLYIPIIKKSKNVPLYVEIDYVSSYNNAFEVLDGIEIVHILGNAPDTSPAQKSIFTHVGNSKTDLATAITGKGVTTSADATFAQMVANINAIEGNKKASGTKNMSSSTELFSLTSGASSNYYFLELDIESLLEFTPSVILVMVKSAPGFYMSVYTKFNDTLNSESVKTTFYQAGVVQTNTVTVYKILLNNKMKIPVVGNVRDLAANWYAYE
ncbi:hypothetical protein [Lysinibacillus capsici]|uniref:hypothetical protein n=1 Tax=Lysinibacillus capsici TaxID=2115968 RepID=UPI00289B0938|nr:hypothetical protein [Lysinibacillus capsici]